MIFLFTMRRFLWEFAKHDLFAKEVRVATWTTIGTLAGLLVLITGGYGLVTGAHDVRLDQLRRDGENRCVRGGSRIVEGKIDNAFLQQLRRALESRLQNGPDAKQTTLQFASHRHNVRSFQAADKLWLDISGRTVKSGDPILTNRPCWSPVQPIRETQVRPVMLELDDTKPGLIVSAEFYDTLLFEDRPPEIHISVGGTRLPLTILGVTDKPLPESLHFLWSERTEAWLEQVDRKLKEPEKQYSIKVPSAWIKENDIDPPPELVNILDSKGICIVPRKDFHEQQLRGYCWDLQPLTDVSQYAMQEWREFARLISDYMAKQGKGALPGVDDAGEIAKQIDPASLPLPANRKDEFVTVYADDVDRLEDIAKIMRHSDFQLNANCEFARQRAEIGNQALMMLGTLFGTIVFATGLGIGGVLAIEAMRADGRKAEIGMLRAIGMSNQVLNGVIALETILQTLIAGVLAAVTTVVLGKFVAWWLYNDPSDRCLGFTFASWDFWRLFLLALFATIVALPIATAIVNYRSRKGEPAELIRF
jgi:hypothetical protein